MTDLVIAVTIGFVFTRFVGFVAETVNRFVENDRARTNKVDKQLAEANERMDKMHRELSAVMAFVTRSTSSGKGNYRTSAGLAGDVVAKLGKIDQSIAQTYKNDLKKYEKFLEDQTKVEEVKDDDQIIVDKSKDLDELFELLNN